MTPEQLIGIVEARIRHAKSISTSHGLQPVVLAQNDVTAMVDHYKQMMDYARGLAGRLEQALASPWHYPTENKPDIDRFVIVEWVQDQIGTRTPGVPPRMELMMMGQVMLENWEDRSNWIKRWCYCPMPGEG